MNKLRLRLEELAVESFETTPEPPARRGTVDAYATFAAGTCPVRVCGVEPTDANTCWYTCDDASCAATCADTCAYTCDDDTCGYPCLTGPTGCGPSCAYSCDGICSP